MTASSSEPRGRALPAHALARARIWVSLSSSSTLSMASSMAAYSAK